MNGKYGSKLGAALMLAYDIISPLFLYMIINLEDAGIQNTFLCKAKALGVYRKCTHQSEEEKHVIFYV